MRYALFFSMLLATSSGVFGQVPDESSPAAIQDNRHAQIKRALARDRGEITAMEPSARDGEGVIIGYSSGAVLNCHGDRDCRQFEGTPAGAVNGAVRDIAVSRQGDVEIVWVAYPHGVLYRCAGYSCLAFKWSGQDK